MDRGILEVVEEVEIVGLLPTTTCMGVEILGHLLDEGRAGEPFSVRLQGTKREDVERGQLPCGLVSFTPRMGFESEVYVLSKILE